MKVKIRTLKQEKYEVEVEPTYTIEKLKEIIEEKHKFEKSTQTLIYAGKILTNEKTIQECNLRNDDFLVLMTKKATGVPPSNTTSATKGTQEKPEPSVSSPTPTPQTTTFQETDEKKPTSSSSSTVVETPSVNDESAIQRIVDMGFSREMVTAALRASSNNTDLAIELLTNDSVPPLAPNRVGSRPPTHATPSSPSVLGPGPVRVGSRTGTTPASPTSPSGQQSSSVFDGLRQHPQFAQLCVLAQQGGEEALKQILQYFAQTNRPLLELIMENQDEFIRLLNTPVRGAVPMGPQGAGPGVIRVVVTPEDETVINNLVNMGFERNRVLEAYFLFDKDEQMTANYLLNNPEGDGGGNFGSQ